jgi:hypothetical protein
MGWESEQNHNSLSAHGLKEAQGFVRPVANSSATGMPPSIRGDAPMSVDPHGAGPKRPLTVDSPDSGSKLRNTYMPKGGRP